MSFPRKARSCTGQPYMLGPWMSKRGRMPLQPVSVCVEHTQCTAILFTALVVGLRCCHGARGAALAGNRPARGPERPARPHGKPGGRPGVCALRAGGVRCQ